METAEGSLVTPHSGAGAATDNDENAAANPTDFLLVLAPVMNDPTAAVVTVTSTYICQPKSRQPPVEAIQTDVFRMRKVGSVWLIDRLGVMNDGRR